MIRKALIGCLFCSWFLSVPAQNELVKARFLVAGQKYSEALVLFEKFDDGLSALPGSVMARGKALAGLEKFDESNRVLELLAAGGNADAAYQMAKNYLAIGNVPEAMRWLGTHLASKDHFPEKQIRLDPVFAGLDNNRDWIRVWQKDWYSEPEQQAAECDYLLSNGKTDEAAELAGQILQGNPRSGGALLTLARIQLARNNMRKTKELVAEAWNVSGDDLRLKDMLLWFAQENGFSEQVTDYASQLLRLDPTNPDYLIARSLSRINSGGESVAEKEIETVESFGIPPAELYYQAGFRVAGSQPRKALQYYNRAIDTGILDARYYYGRGMAQLNLGNAEAALGDLAMSLDINPRQPDLYMARAQFRYDNGDEEGACHDWTMALGLGVPQAADLLYKFCRLP